MLTETVSKRKEILEPYGFRELTPELVSTECHTQYLWGKLTKTT